MSRYILFTSVGKTDPIKGHKEGAILQICRKYKPEKIYMFLSQQIYQYHIKDDRYRLCIRKLAEDIDGFNPEIEIIADQNLRNVHKFDIYYDEFESRLEEIQKRYPEHTILLNISSCTPGMKNALNLIAALHDNHLLPVQVAAPETQYEEAYIPFNIEAEWAANLDNINSPSSAHIRVEEEKNLNLLARFKKEMIKKHIRVYDYHAAYSIARDINRSMSALCMKLLKAACCRIQLDEEGLNNTLAGTGLCFTNYESGNKKNIAEYLLWLQIKQLRRDYADFIRGITPVVVDLFEIILEHHTGIHLPDYCEKQIFSDQHISYRITKRKLCETKKGEEILEILESTLKSPLRDDYYTSKHISILINHYIQNNRRLVGTVKSIRYVESQVRNLAAHEIVSITDDWIRDRCGMNSAEIMNKLRYLASEAAIAGADSDELWSSYDRMNQIIEENII